MLRGSYRLADSAATQRGANGLTLNTLNRIESRTQMITGSMTHTLSPSVILDLRASYGRYVGGSSGASANPGPGASDVNPNAMQKEGFRKGAALFTRLEGCCAGDAGRAEVVGFSREVLVRFDPVYHGHFKCNRNPLTAFPALWGYARDLFQTPGFGDTVDFVQIKQHYYLVHTDINPSRIVPRGPDLANWLSPHGRDVLGGRPFGDGTPPPPPRVAESVPPDHAPRRHSPNP